jgi:hypothetical protein
MSTAQKIEPVPEQRGSVPDGESVAVKEPSLDDLIVAYHSPGAGRPVFERLREHFCDYQEADIKEQYFTHTAAAAVVLLCQRERATFRIKFDYERGIANSKFDDVLGALYKEQLESALILRGSTQTIVVQRVYAVIANLLSVLDSCKAPGLDETAKEKRLNDAVECARADLKSIEQFVEKGTRRQAVGPYLAGFPIGLAFSGLLVAIFAMLPIDIGRAGGSGALAVCLGAGAIGAMISVMSRITGGKRPEIDSDQNRSVTILAGAFRPIVGAVFGAVLYALIIGGLVPIATPGTGPGAADVGFFFAAIAFLAGFSERWAQDTIVQSTPGVHLGSKRGAPQKQNEPQPKSTDQEPVPKP